VPETTPRIEDTLIRGYRQLASATPTRSRDALLRGLDVAFSTLFLLVLLPLTVLIALATVATSGRPIFYVGERVGRGGRIFHMIKFRTLKPDAENRLGPYLGTELVSRTETARRDPAVLERPPRRHEPRRPAADSPDLLRGARS
jgi:lipopolysaccharide/colanic/teichoic acid biosynthesis glycosyltransferase